MLAVAFRPTRTMDTKTKNMQLILLQGVVMAKAWYDAYDTNYSVKTKKVRVGFLKWETKKVIIKDEIYYKQELDIETFNVEQRYYSSAHEVVMYKPHCDLYLSNQSRQSKFFDTEKELSDFMDFLKENNVTIELCPQSNS